MTFLRERDSEIQEYRTRYCRPGRLLTEEALAILVHDLRTPLGAIQNALNVLQLVRAGDPAVEQAAGVMRRQVGQLGRLIGDLLDLARVRTGKLELRQEWLDLGTAVANAAEACRPCLDQGHHQLTISLPPGPVRLRADPARLQQILVNLLTNAAKYTDPGGHIGLTAEAAVGVLVVRVRDDGIGIGPDLLPHVFDLFQQGAELGDREWGGLGVGLALVKRLAELHGGGVTASSDGPGKGSEFVVRLPAPANLAVRNTLFAPADPHCSGQG